MYKYFCVVALPITKCHLLMAVFQRESLRDSGAATGAGNSYIAVSAVSNGRGETG
jgi:hypothetical protein